MSRRDRLLGELALIVVVVVAWLAVLGAVFLLWELAGGPACRPA